MVDTPKYCKATIVWKSGREDVYKDKLLKGGKLPKKFFQIVCKHKDFPTVKEVIVERF